MTIQATGLSRTFDGGKTWALDGVSVKVEQGEFVAIVGLSGAGKSTFLRHINGTLLPTKGDMAVLGHRLSALKSGELTQLRREIGFIFQQFNLIKSISVLKNVLIGRVAYNPLWRSLLGIFKKEDIHASKKALDSVGLKDRYDEIARNLSGGQQQRVAIARALVQNPKIILADEPMASLDPKLSEVVLQILKKVNREQNITVLVNIHVLEYAKKYASRIIAFQKGKIVFDDKPDQFTEKVIDEIYHVDHDVHESVLRDQLVSTK